MSRLLRRMIGSMVIIIIVNLLLFVSVVTLVDPNHFKDRLCAFVTEVTNRPFSIEGNLRWCLTPVFSLEVNDLNLGNLSNYADEFLKIKTVRIKPKMSGLLKGRFLLDVDAIDVHLNLAKSLNQNNWSDLKSIAASLNALNTIHLKNVELSYTNHQTEQKFKMHNTELQILDLSEAWDTTYVPFYCSGQWHENKKEDLYLKISGRWQYSSSIQSIVVQNLKIEARATTIAPTLIQGEGKIEKLAESPSISGKLYGSIFDINQWWSYFNIKIPENYSKLATLQSQSGLYLSSEPIKFQTIFGYQDAMFDVPYFQIDLTQGQFFSGNLNWQARESVLSGNLLARQIQFGGLPCPELKCRFKVHPTMIAVEEYEIQLVKNKHLGNLEINLLEALPKYKWQNEIKDSSVDEILELLKIDKQLYGRLQLKSELHSAGITFDELKNHLTGTVSAVLYQGKFLGIDLVSLLQHTEMTFKKLRETLKKGQAVNVGAVLTSELLEWRQQALSKEPLKTEFDKLEANFKVEKGIIKNDLLKIQHPKYIVSGQGMFDVENSLVNFESSAQLQSLEKMLPLSIKIQGPLHDLAIRPLLENYAKQTLQVTGEINKETPTEEKNPKALEKLFGFS